LYQPKQFSGNISAKLPAAFFAAAGGKKNSAARSIFFQPAQEAGALGIAAQPVEPQFDGGSLPECAADLPRSQSRRRRRHHRAKPAQTASEDTHLRR